MNTSREKFVPYFFLIPAFIGLVLFRIAPVISSLIESFLKVSFANGAQKSFCLFDNYKTALSDQVFIQALLNTLKFIIAIVPFEIIWAFALALLVNHPIKRIGIFRTIFFIPFTISLAITSTIWGIMYNPNGGFVNSIFELFRIPSQQFLTSASQALPSIIFFIAWRAVGYWMIFLISGLQNISPSLYESAQIDGARGYQSFFYITLPMMKRTFLFVLVANTTENILMFTPMYILTGGGPQNSTNVAMYEAYREVFIYADRGVGNAMVMLMIVLILLIIIAEFKLMRKED
ncbi:MAG: sugar ABC transporter permease [Spirochaetia bacterium]|jgi:multiple sugar transport system permease protein|nr:sugar ABC transporter permease [Spirochaetia bacterium]